VTLYVYAVAGWLLLAGAFGIVRSRDLVHAVVSLAVAQAGTYVLLVGVGFQHGGGPPVFGSPPRHPTVHVVDPVVQAMTLTDIVVSATVTALLLAIALQLHRRRGTTDPDELNSVQG